MSLITQLLPKKETKEYFLILSVDDHRITASVAEITGNNISILGFGDSELKEGEDSEAADIAITAAESSVADDTFVRQVIFALPAYFLDGDEVKPEYVDRLKRITKELDLQAKGFIEYPSAICFHLEKEDGSPPTLLLLGVSQKHLTFSLIRVGKIQQTIITERGEDILSDFSKALPQFISEILPSRIIIYNSGKHLDEFRDKLLKFPWHKHSLFLHTPKIEILTPTQMTTALVEAGGSSFLRTIPKELKEQIATATQPSSAATETSGHHIGAKETAHHAANSQTESISSEFGFTRKPIRRDTYHPPQPVVLHRAHDSSHHAYSATDQEEISESQTVQRKERKFSFPLIHMPSFYLPRFASKSFVYTGSVVFAVILFALFFWEFPTATVVLFTYPYTTVQSFDVTFTTQENQVSSDKNILLARTISEDISGEKTAEVTGISNVGERAKGEVAIYNKTVERKTFPKGTTLLNGGLKFTLDDEVTIASASDTGEGLTFGKETVKLTASAIGPESNLPAEATFKLQDFPESSYNAKNPSAFSGGTIREVTSVSKEDQKNLENALTQELLTKAKQQLSQKLNLGEKLIEQSIKNETGQKKFNHQAGDEVKELTLSLTLKFIGLSFEEKDLFLLSQSLFTDVPPGYSRNQQYTDVDLQSVSVTKDDLISTKATVRQRLLPELSLEEIKNGLAGKTYDEASNYLPQVPNVGGFKIIEHRPLPLPSFDKRLPINKDNLILQVVYY